MSSDLTGDEYLGDYASLIKDDQEIGLVRLSLALVTVGFFLVSQLTHAKKKERHPRAADPWDEALTSAGRIRA